VAGVLGLLDGANEDINPLAHDGSDAVANDSAAAVKFKGSGAEKTAAAEDALLDKSEPLVEQAPEARHSFGSRDGGAANVVNENLTGQLDGSQLQLFLGTKVGKKAALTHAELGGESTEGEALEALDGGNIDGAGEDGFAGSEAASLRAGSTRLAGGAGDGGHEKIVTHRNK